MNFKKKSVIFLATGCYVGNIPFAPGLFGTILGILPCFILSIIDLPAGILFTVIFLFIAVWSADEAEKIMDKKDPGCIVIDEIAGIMVTLFNLPFNITYIVAGFVIFRLLDVFKPFPIGFLEKKISGGLGIVVDDVAAGIIGNIILQLVFLIK